MATVNLGSIKFNWKGAYNNSTAYVVDDVISSAGASYICILASTGNTAPNATYWELMSIAGVDGNHGTDLGTVITTQGDVAYRDASGLQRLAAGTDGQVLKTQGASANPVWGDGGGGLTSVQVFTSSATWTKPAGIKSVRVQLVGSGASGNHSGQGGGAAGYSEKFIDVSAISSESVTVGAASTSGNTAGATSSFGSHCSATGGEKGTASRGGKPGLGSGGDINMYGGGGNYQASESGFGGSSYFGGPDHGSDTTREYDTGNCAYGAGGMGIENGYTQYGIAQGGIVIVWEYK